MKFLANGMDWLIQFLYLSVEFLLRLLAEASNLILLVGLVLEGAGLLPGVTIFASWRWVPLVWSLALAIGLESNLIVLALDAVLDRVPVWAEGEVRTWRKMHQAGRMMMIGILGVVVVVSIVLSGQSFAVEVQPWLIAVRSITALMVVVFNLVVSPVVRHRVGSALAVSQAHSLQKMLVKEGNRL